MAFGTDLPRQGAAGSQIPDLLSLNILGRERHGDHRQT
jgi:hypothetical protein